MRIKGLMFPIKMLFPLCLHSVHVLPNMICKNLIDCLFLCPKQWKGHCHTFHCQTSKSQKNMFWQVKIPIRKHEHLKDNTHQNGLVVANAELEPWTTISFPDHWEWAINHWLGFIVTRWYPKKWMDKNMIRKNNDKHLNLKIPSLKERAPSPCFQPKHASNWWYVTCPFGLPLRRSAKGGQVHRLCMRGPRHLSYGDLCWL